MYNGTPHFETKSEPLTSGPVKTMSEIAHLLNVLMLDTKFSKFL